MNGPAPETPDRPGLWQRWHDTEPVRRALWPATVAALGVLIAYGLVTTEQATAWLGLGAAILGVGAINLGATALARRVAWAPATVRVVADDHAERLADEAYEDGWHRGWDDRGEHEHLVPHDPPGQHAAHPSTTVMPAQQRPGVPPATP